MGRYRKSRKMKPWASSLRVLGILIATLVLASTAEAAITQQNRTFTEVTVAADTGFFIVTPAAGILLYVTDQQETAFDPDFGSTTTVLIRKLKFAVDPARITHIVENESPRPIQAGEVFVLAQTNPFGASPLFNTATAPVAGASALGSGLTRVLVPYGTFEGGCGFINQLGIGFTCRFPSGAQHLNDDSDYFDTVLAYAEIIIDGTTITSVQLVTTTIDAQGPFATNGKQIVFLNPERGDGGCVFSAGSRLADCYTPGAGVDLNGDGRSSTILTVHDVDTSQTAYTQIQLDVDFSPAATLRVAGDLLVFPSPERAPVTGFCDFATPPNCTPSTPGVDYNGNGTYTDTVVRYLSLSGVLATPELSSTVGPTVSTSTSGPGGGMLLGTDGRRIAYLASEAEAPIFNVFPPNCADLSGDCDNSDFVLQLYDTLTDTTLDTTGAGEPFGSALSAGARAVVADGIVTLDTRESLNQDFNDDGDFEDTQLRFFELATQTLVTTDVTLVQGPGQPSSIRADVATDGQVIV